MHVLRFSIIRSPQSLFCPNELQLKQVEWLIYGLSHEFEINILSRPVDLRVGSFKQRLFEGERHERRLLNRVQNVRK